MFTQGIRPVSSFHGYLFCVENKRFLDFDVIYLIVRYPNFGVTSKEDILSACHVYNI